MRWPTDVNIKLDWLSKSGLENCSLPRYGTCREIDINFVTIEEWEPCIAESHKLI